MSTTTAEQVFDTWEEMEASGALDRKLNALQLSSLDNPQNSNRLVDGKIMNNGRMIILGEDGMRSQYVSPKPTVKILKRPQRDGNTPDGGLANGGDKPKQPIKSLKQREQEYAEARKRILGEEKSPEEKETTTNNDNTLLSFQSKTSSIFNQSNSSISHQQQQQQQQQQYITAATTVIRMPNGPVDGTTGFNVRR